jgi:hypothetical protein
MGDGMSTMITDCWPDDIKVEVLTPLAILKAQEGLLAQKTRGMLQAKLSTTESEKLVQHQLDLIAPGLNFYRERLLTATHDRTMLYPVIVTSEAFASPEPLDPLKAAVASLQRSVDTSLIQRKAATDEELLGLVRQVLQSERVRALIHSLIARLNAERSNSQGNGPAAQEDQADQGGPAS